MQLDMNMIGKLVADALGISTAKVGETRAALLAEQATADARYACNSALEHPEGSTTPLNEAYSRAQGRYADLRRELERALPKTLALLLAAEIAEQRRDEALRHRDDKWLQQSVREDQGVHEAVISWWGRLHRHGVHPHHVKQHDAETVAIIADLINWKAKDPTFKVSDNPWRDVLTVYAGRTIEKPGKQGKGKRSATGTPIRPRHGTSGGPYMFNEMVKPEWGRASTPVPSKEASVADDTNSKASPADLTADSGAIATQQTPTDYPLPYDVRESDTAILREMAERWIEMDPDVMFQLEQRLNEAGSDTEDTAIIATVEAARSYDVTPFRYFVDAAREHGIEAGRAAYREASVRRLAQQFAVGDEWKELRAKFGLSW